MILNATSWHNILEILKLADTLNFPRKTHEEIISDLRAFRETISTDKHKYEKQTPK